MSISIQKENWLKDFIEFVLENYDLEAAEERSSKIEGETPEEKGLQAIHKSLEYRGAANGLPKFYPDISEENTFPVNKFLSTLRHQMEIVLDVGVALNRPFEGTFGKLALTMIGWATRPNYDRMEYLADLWIKLNEGEISPEEIENALENEYAPLGESYKETAILRDDPLLALPINQGISYFDIYLAGRLGLDLYDDNRLQRHEVEQTHQIVKSDRIHFIEAVIALAWSNGILEPEERNLIKKQIQMLGLSKKESRRLINLMITPSTPKEFAHAFSSPETGMFVMRQLIIASVIDGQQDAKEKKFLLATAKEFGLSEAEFNQLQEEMKKFLQDNWDSIEQMKNYRPHRRVSL